MHNILHCIQERKCEMHQAEDDHTSQNCVRMVKLLYKLRYHNYSVVAACSRIQPLHY